MSKLYHLLAFICVVQIVDVTSYRQNLANVDYYRAETIAMEKVLWQKIMEFDDLKNSNMSALKRPKELEQHELIKKVLAYHVRLTFAESSPLMEIFKRSYFYVLSIIPEWANIECDIVTVSNKFDNFRKHLNEINGIIVEDVLDQIESFAGELLTSSYCNVNELFRAMIDIMEHKAKINFYEEVQNVRI